MPAYNKIILKNSSVSGAIPQPAFLEYGELALNYADGYLYYKDSDNQVIIYGDHDSAVAATPNTKVKRDNFGSIFASALTIVPNDTVPYIGVTAKSITTFGAISSTVSGTYSHGFYSGDRLKMAVQRENGSLHFHYETNGIDYPYTILQANTPNANQVYTLTLPKITGTLAIADTDDGFINTESIIGLRGELDGIITDIASLTAALSIEPDSTTSGKIIYVDSVIGNDTRTNITKYTDTFPFKTIEAAVNASVGDSITIDDSSIIGLNGLQATVNLNNHGLISGKIISVSGNTNTPINVTDAVITVVSKDVFTYQTTVSGSGEGSGTTVITIKDEADLIYVRSGNYAISSQISLNGKGNIYCEPHTNIYVSGAAAAFSLSRNESKRINGYANFTIAATAGLISQSDGSIDMQFNSAAGTSSGMLFSITGGSFVGKFSTINTPNANAFILQNAANLTVHDSYEVNCIEFLECTSTGNVNIDLLKINGNSADTIIRVANANTFLYRGADCTNSAGSGSCVIFAYTNSGNGPTLRNVRLRASGTPLVCNNNGTFRDVFLDCVKINSIVTTNPSISSSNKLTRVYSANTCSNVLPHTSIIIDGNYNVMSKLF